jgi:hypothetical protein
MAAVSTHGSLLSSVCVLDRQLISIQYIFLLAIE